MFGGWGSTDILIVVWIWWSLALHCMLNFIYVMFWIHDVQTWLINNIIVFIYRYNCVYIYIYTIIIYKKHIYIYIPYISKLGSRGSFPDPKRGPSCLKKCGLPQVGTVTLSSLERPVAGKRSFCGGKPWNCHAILSMGHRFNPFAETLQ